MTDPNPTRPPLMARAAPGPLAPRSPDAPPPTRSRLTVPLLAVILLSLIPALVLAWQRVQFEQAQKTVALVMDYPAMAVQAQRVGLEPQALLDRYKALGVNGAAVYEDVIGNLVQRGDLYERRGSDLAAENPGEGVNPQWVYMRALTPRGAEELRTLPGRYTIPTREVTIAGQKWLGWPTDPDFLPAGPNMPLINDLKAQGLVVVYRPYDDEALRDPAGDWPDVPFIAFTGDEVIGARVPERLERVNQALGNRLPAIIESSDQRGLDTLVETHGGARMFALNPSWQNRIGPIDTASKYALAARERSQRLLYLRPFPTVYETTTFLKRTSDLLQHSGVKVGQPVITPFQPNATLRWLSVFGPLAALLLLGLSFPLPRLGLAVAMLAGLAALGLNGLRPFESVALIAAITFPALGLVLRRSKVTDWFLATGLSLIGVLFVSGLGANRDSVLGLEPFKGVGLTLLVPLVFVGLSFLPRQDIRKTAQDIYNAPLRLGDIAVMALGLGVFALVFLRRGNSTGLGVSDTEAQLRQNLQDTIIRPRFKEVAGHPLGLLGLSGVLPGYFSLLLLLGGVVGQASILNTFSHFHTPLLISAARVFIGLGVGLLLGLILIPVVQYLLRLWNTYGTRRAPKDPAAEVRA
ncbi:DUF5693 family protein [Deinococcus metallilatus]|uniref:Uncharacterized protein n=1 Tax=Deinococcus metallilatus TaxID=1211322 RepID=A0ABR6MYC4_9DEIO|nr:DUF5693 family protein [Deinococcus metallilatus]MBB5296350.1 hypothetical protein [Deinococcus metallilatus]GMA14736.1 hypothetical protein GCM10025871_10670 [Deinococcus metallilatus]